MSYQMDRLHVATYLNIVLHAINLLVVDKVTVRRRGFEWLVSDCSVPASLIFAFDPNFLDNTVDYKVNALVDVMHVSPPMRTLEWTEHRALCKLLIKLSCLT